MEVTEAAPALRIRYLVSNEADERLKIGVMGVEESLHNIVLALILTIISALLCAVGMLRTLRSSDLTVRNS